MATKEKSNQPEFTKEQFLISKSYTGLEKDIFRALLDDNKTYTKDQVREIADDFVRKEVQ
ncbi:hypothetical protein P5G65_04875 [Paenibacillus chondroitinus]|uniref:Uncharacterized protein n=1 Tax=Paenibacillus chondroitinus TaxID=59842 RepID=A0ABU6D668_9BACL|nr:MULTISPECIES: hypothetical protein [Paenibacillus]MCY9658119.1 hypothetical protein [Paenibacillus anseongense]MEB4793219.1 hypothetical protein [Paenibacillus chondroitinus]